MMDTPKKSAIPMGPALQGLTVVLLSIGGFIGKGAYEDLRSELVQSRIEQAETRKVVEAMSARQNENASGVAQLRAEIAMMRDRLTALETEAREQRRDQRRRR